MPRPTKPALLCVLLAPIALAAQLERVVVLKIDGLPPRLVEQYLQQRPNPSGRSPAKWLDYVFVRGGVSLDNFYVRGLSLSAPAWSLLDTGRHLEIRGNVEYDRYTLDVHDYLNFFPFYIRAGVGNQVDMPGVELLDEHRVPLLIDRFPHGAWYQGAQLLQRGVNWKTMDGTLKRTFSAGSVRGFIDEWQVGWSWQESWTRQNEELLVAALKDPAVRYLELFSGDYDHIAHLTNDIVTQLHAIEAIDALVGRVWNAIQQSPLAARTALVLVSDHGMNTDPSVISQGYNLVEWFNSATGGGHHVLTNRHPLQEFKIKGLDPFVSKVITPSTESGYLQGQGELYPTVMLDLDGNERASIGLRNNTLNLLHLLLDQLIRKKVTGRTRQAVLGAFFETLDAVRADWRRDLEDLNAQLAELQDRVHAEEVAVAALPKKWTPEQTARGEPREANRARRRLQQSRQELGLYTQYAATMKRLLDLTPADFDPGKFKIQDLIPPRSLGPANSVWDVQNYVAGLGSGGVVLAEDGHLNLERSIRRVNYVPALAALAVRNNVQEAVSAHPVDFMALRARLPDGAEAIWLYRDEERQALIARRGDRLRYQPIARLRAQPDGSVVYEERDWAPGFPLDLFEDPALDTPGGDRTAWLSEWHSEREWLEATHRTRYSNGIIGLTEHLLELSPPASPYLDRKRRQRRTDLLVFAANHWNFNVRGFNPGGNHGSLLRESTHSVLMIAGGEETGIPKGLRVRTPYDSLSFAPTILHLMGRAEPDLPGPPIAELTGR